MQEAARQKARTTLVNAFVARFLTAFARIETENRKWRVLSISKRNPHIRHRELQVKTINANIATADFQDMIRTT